jgi:hypothetical protein
MLRDGDEHESFFVYRVEYVGDVVIDIWSCCGSQYPSRFASAMIFEVTYRPPNNTVRIGKHTVGARRKL